MTTPVDLRRGFKRLALGLAIAAAVAAGLYMVGDGLIVARRKQLVPVEIILYIVIANILTVLVVYAGYRAARWVIQGFAGPGPRRDDGGGAE